MSGARTDGLFLQSWRNEKHAAWYCISFFVSAGFCLFSQYINAKLRQYNCCQKALSLGESQCFLRRSHLFSVGSVSGFFFFYKLQITCNFSLVYSHLMHCFPLKTLCSVESRITNHPWPGGMITLCVPVTSLSWIHVWHLFGDIQKFLILHLKMKTRTPLSSEAQTRAACSRFSKKEISFDKMLTEGGGINITSPSPQSHLHNIYITGSPVGT